MAQISIIGLDLAKSSFQVHAADVSGRCVERRKLSRAAVLGYFAAKPACLVVMEACSGAHYWAREIAKLGHETRLIAPAYVKPYLKRQKNDAADAEAICEAASRPTMRFIRPKTDDQQAQAIAFRARDLLIRQRTQIINALRGHCAEYGVVVAQGPSHIVKLVALIEAPDTPFPAACSAPLKILTAQLAQLNDAIAALDAEIAARAKACADARRLMTMPGVGPVIAAALTSLAPAAESFENGRHFAAWLGLVPKQNSTGGKERLGQISRAGDRNLRRLLIIGAMSVVRWLGRKPPAPGSWLAGMVARKPPKLIAVALANKMARIAWALMAHKQAYRASPVAAA
jgi:transposase